jgi:hypothetical protein
LIIDGGGEFDKKVLAMDKEKNMNNFLKYKMEVNQKCDDNLQRRSIFKGIKLHNF